MPSLSISRCLIALLLVVPALRAQRADSAATARGLMRTAGEQLASGDTAAAAGSVLAASRAWPRQLAYQVTAARMLVAAGRHAEAVNALGRANAGAYAWNPDNPALDPLRALPGFAELAATARASAAPLVRSAVYRALPDAMLHPEGIAHDSITGRIYVSSVRRAKVVVIEPDGRVRDFVPASAGLEATFGLAVDRRRGVLWIATSRTPEQERPGTVGHSGAALVAVDLEDGREAARWVIADTSRPHLLGDLALGPDGTLWATDSRTPALYRVEPGSRGGPLEPAPIRSPDWVSLQGVAIAPSGGEAWVADWTTGLFHIDLASGEVHPVAAAVEDVTLGIDGLYLVGPRRLIGIQNGMAPARVVEVTLDADGRRVDRLRVLDRHLPLAEEPTLGVVARGALLYVANSPWGHYRADGTPDPARPFPVPTLLRLPLDR